MIGIVIRELTYLKILQPIICELINLKVPYYLYIFDAPRAGKEYNRPNIERIKKSSEVIIKHAAKVKAFTNDPMLLKQLTGDRISKLVSLEIFLWAKGYLPQLEKLKIKIYSILYLCDSMWTTNAKSITNMHKIYYTTPFLRDLVFGFLGLKTDPNRDRCLGSPIFDCLSGQTGSDVLVLLPNLKSDNVKSAFGSEANFVSIIEKLAQNNKLIFKTRKKQWFPESIRRFASEIIMDDEVMYPSSVSKIFKKTHTTVLFFSSGIFEAVQAGQYIINIPIPLARWNWERKKLEKFFATQSDQLYNFEGVVENVPQDTILSKDWTLRNNLILENRSKWLDKYVGSSIESAKKIALDIIK